MDIRWIRAHSEALDASLVKRGQEPESAALLELDAAWRQLHTELQRLQQARNSLADRIAQAKATQLPCDSLMGEALELKEKEEAARQQASRGQRLLQEKLLQIPNVLADDVPEGRDEHANVEVRRWGEPALSADEGASFFDHVTLGERLNGLDLPQAALVSGARFSYLRGQVARLERALANWLLDTHAAKGYEEFSVPYLVHPKSMEAAGQLPKFLNELFQTTDQRFLIPTAEISLVNWGRNRTFEASELPIRMTAYSPCFRAEAGAAGRDVGGIMRMHQFHKVELVEFCTPEASQEAHEEMVRHVESLLRRLQLPYRVMLLCAGDTGFCAAKTYDLEVWIPSERRYREISSCSNTHAFQAVRAQCKYRPHPSEPATYLHMLNGSGLPTGRTLLALLENHQTPEGLRVPEVLRPYMGGQEFLA